MTDTGDAFFTRTFHVFLQRGEAAAQGRDPAAVQAAFAPLLPYFDRQDAVVDPSKLAAAQSALALFLLRAGDPVGSVREVGAALGRLPLSGREDAEPANGMAELLLNAGNVLNASGRAAEARAAMDQAVSVRRSLRALLERNRHWSAGHQNGLAEAYRNRGAMMASQGQLADALTDFDHAIALCEGLRDSLERKGQWHPEFRGLLAAAYGNRATALSSQGRLGEAVTAHHLGIAVRKELQALVQRRGEWTPERANDLAGAYTNLGGALQKQGHLKEAVCAYGEAIDIGKELRRRLERDGQWSQDLRIGLARPHYNRGSALRALGEPHEALREYDSAITILQECREQLGPDMDLPLAALNGLAGAYAGRGGALDDMGRLQESKSAYDQVVALLNGLRDRPNPPAVWSASLCYDLARAYSGGGSVLSSQGRFAEAVEEHRKGIDVLVELRVRLGQDDWTPELRIGLGKLYSNRGSALSAIGRLAEAAEDHERAVACGRETRSAVTNDADWSPELRGSLATNLMNRANVLYSQGRLGEAIEAYRESIVLMEAVRSELQEDGLWSPRMRLDLAKVYMNYGNALDVQGNQAEAIAAHSQAIAVGEGIRRLLEDKNQWECEFRDLLGQCYSNRGVAFVAENKLKEAEADFKSAISIGVGLRRLLEPQNQWPVKYRNDLAVACLNHGVALGAQGKRGEALKAYWEARSLNKPLPGGALDEGDVVRITLSANLAALLDLIADQVAWAREESVRMAELLDQRPPTQERKSTVGELHRQFALFHARWLAWCVRSGHLELIPEILAIVQGRELAAEVLDQISLEDPATPAKVRAFHELRLKLRKLNARIEAVIAGGQAGGGDGPAGSGRAGLPKPPAWDEAIYTALVTEHRALVEQIPALRQAAAKVPGYDYLEFPYKPLDLTTLQDGLGLREALVVLIDPEEGDPGVLVVRPQGQPLWRAAPELPALVLAVRLFDAADDWQPLLELEQIRAPSVPRLAACDRLLGGYRRGMTETRAGGDQTAEKRRLMESQKRRLLESLGAYGEPVLQAFCRRERFWGKLTEAMEHLLWAGLSPHLQGIDQATVIPHGELHLLPLAAGAPAGLRLSRYPGLAFYAHRRGLYGQPPTPAAAADSAVGLIGFAGERGDIPLAEAEAMALARLYQDSGTRVYHPSGYPNPEEAEPAGLLHIACHGGEDPHNPQRVALFIAQRQGETTDTRHVLNQDAIVASPTPPLDLYFSACLGGQTVEGLSGTPSGLVSACFRRNARWVAGALVSIPDHWAMLLALLTHQAIVNQGLPLPAALAEGKRRLASGDWYDDTGARLRGALAEPLRRLAEAGVQGAWERLWGDFCEQAVPTLLQGWDLTDAEIANLHQQLRHHGPETLAEPLAAALTNLWPSRPRVPPEPALGTLIHGLVVFGEAAL